ncbi:MAG TPA: hypothetical protein VL989_02020 [Candidatus Sulfotelmatobacter sp.]|nr:hypothetical protein [Candidatus Sulfotelmatobacter sp.]
MTTPEQSQPRELTKEDWELGDYLIVQCDLQDVAEVQIEVHGQSGTVRYGLAHSGKYLLDLTPDEIRMRVHAMLEAQESNSSNGSAA